MDSQEHSPPQIATLLGANMPADRGLSGLGLIMQLAGSVLVAYGLLVTIMPMMMPPVPERLVLFLIGASCVIRSAFHRSAGTTLLFGSSRGHLYGIKRYIVVALVQSVVVFLLLKKMEVPSDFALYLLIVLVAWPVALALVLNLLPQFKSISDKGLPNSEDMGFESAAVLMTIMGIAGSLVMAILVYSMLKSSAFRLEVPGMLLLAVGGMLLARSIIHARAGLQGISGVHADHATASTNAYINFGIVSAIIAGAVFLVQMLMAAGGIGIELLIVVIGISYLLLTWPTILRSFFTDRNFSLLLDEDSQPRRAPDTGLTALGWLLFALGVMGMSFAIGGLILGGKNSDLLSKMAYLPQIGGPSAHSLWWDIGVNGLQLFAGVTLIRMDMAHKLVVSVYGVAVSLVSIYLAWPVIKFIKASEFESLLFVAYTPLIVSLTVSVGAVILVNRQQAPDAKARMIA